MNDMNETSKNEQPTADSTKLDKIAETIFRDSEDRTFQTLLDPSQNKLELLELVAPKLAQIVDEESLHEVNTTFVNEHQILTKEDYVFEGKALFHGVTFDFVVLTAHQSSSNRHMALRILRTMAGLWGRDWSDSKRKSKKEPFEQRLVLPILIHTGKSKWRLKSMRDLVFEFVTQLNLSDDLKQLFLRVTPDFEILMLDLANHDLEDLAGRGTFLSCVLSAMGAKHSKEQIRKISGIVARRISEGKIDESDQKEIVRTFLKVLLTRGQSHVKVALEQFNEVLRKNKTMLDKNSYAYEIIHESLAKGMKQGVAQGMKQGVAQGMKQGMKQGVAQGLETLRESILKLILKRFQGTSESEAQSRLAKLTDLKKLKAINDRAFDWQDFDDVWTTSETGDA